MKNLPSNHNDSFSRPKIHNNDPLSAVISRLEGLIKRHNGGFLAYCPNHDDKKGRSLAVSVGRKDQILLHCFAGCSVSEITGAIGLDMSDLFVKSDQQTYDKQSRSYHQEWQILKALQFDALIVLVAANRLLAGDALPKEDVNFLSQAVLRIDEAVHYSLRGDR